MGINSVWNPGKKESWGSWASQKINLIGETAKEGRERKGKAAKKSKEKGSTKKVEINWKE